MLEGIKRQLDTMRADFRALALPIEVRLHGAPSNAPAIQAAPYGSTCFRGPAGYYVEIRHMGPMSEADYDRVGTLLSRHSSVIASSFYAGTHGNPIT